MTKILGTTDDTTTCDCCGKTNLKKTVVLDIDGSVVFYGTDCAARALTGSKKDKKVVDSQATAIETAKRWLAKGFKVEVVRDGIWNKFGYRTSFKNNKIQIENFGEIEVN